MTNRDDDQLARWLSQGPDRGPTAALEATLARVPSIRQRPGWLVGIGGGTGAERPVNRRVQLGLVTAVTVLAITAGGLFVSGAIDPMPDPSSTVEPSPTIELPPTTAPDAEVIVFTERREVETGKEGCTGQFHCFWSWVAIVNTDGTDHRRLFPEGPRTQSVAAVSANGSRVIVQGIKEVDNLARNPTYYVTDLQASEPADLDTRCVLPCTSDYIGPLAFSPDGGRIAFVRFVTEVPLATGDEGTSSVLAIMDLETGAVTELASTFASNPFLDMPCGYACGAGSNESPRWSPDGRQLVFSRSSIGIPDQPRKVLDTALFIVDADGSNLRQLVPLELFGRDAQWSPDGTLIVFTSAIETLTLDRLGLLEDWHQLNDTYTVRPDGTDLRRLTSFTAGPVPDQPGDLGATLPTWTRDGRIVVSRRVAEPGNPEETHWELWVLDSDGANATMIDGEAATLTALGCVECPYPYPNAYDYPAVGFWRPMP